MLNWLNTGSFLLEEINIKVLPRPKESRAIQIQPMITNILDYLDEKIINKYIVCCMYQLRSMILLVQAWHCKYRESRVE